MLAAKRTCRLASSLLLLALTASRTAGAYSVLSHEEVVDMAWKPQIVPMLRARFPGITNDQIRHAHAYAYGGSVIQDIGYYPFGNKYFSDLLHYVRTGDFVAALIRDSTTPDDYAFALGALAHFSGDEIGHPYVNQVTAQENPPLRHRFGSIVTYEEDPTAHVRTEFGFDVVQVAHGSYSQENYRDFIGFQVSKPLLERAFQETYGLRMSDVITHEDLAISTYRKSVSTIIPQMTRLAYVNYRKQIQQAAPAASKRTFEYRLDQTEYRRSFGTDYTHVGFGGRLAAFFLKIVPKIGPFKALKVSIPNPQQQDLYLKSVNESVDRFRFYLAQVQADPAPLPPPDPTQAVATAKQDEKAAGKLDKDADKMAKLAEKSPDPNEKAQREQVAANVAEVAQKASSAAARSDATAAAVAAGTPPPIPVAALPPDAPIPPPTPPTLPATDLDTGHPSRTGEYVLADETWARLLDELVKSVKAPAPAPAGSPAAVAASDTPPNTIDPALAASIETFFAQFGSAPSVPPVPSKQAEKLEAKRAALTTEIQTDLATLKTLTAQTAAPVPTGRE